MIVIDTHALVWIVEADPQIGRRAIKLIDDERAAEGVAITPITAWETAMLVNKNRLALGRAVGDWFDRILSSQGFILTPLTVPIAIDAGTLPGKIHGDPADRLIIATARALGCPLLTGDKKILDYAKAGRVQAIDARD